MITLLLFFGHHQALLYLLLSSTKVLSQHLHPWCDHAQYHYALASPVISSATSCFIISLQVGLVLKKTQVLKEMCRTRWGRGLSVEASQGGSYHSGGEACVCRRCSAGSCCTEQWKIMDCKCTYCYLRDLCVCNVTILRLRYPIFCPLYYGNFKLLSQSRNKYDMPCTFN